MAIGLSDNIYSSSPKPLEAKYATLTGVPYSSSAEVTSSIPLSNRYQGLTVLVSSSTEVAEYWFKGGIANTDLILKTVDGTFLTTASNENNGNVLTISKSDGSGYQITIDTGSSLGSSNFTASFNDESTWEIHHGLDYQYVLVQVYDDNNNQIIPEEITLTNNNTASVTFGSSVTGTAVVSVGGSTLNATLPVGSNTQIQYNDGGVFGASSNFTFNGSTNLYTLKSISGGRTSFQNSSQYYNNSQVLQINELDTAWISGSTTGYQFGDKFSAGAWSVGSPISPFDIVFLSGSDSTWYRVVQSNPSLASRLLGIYIPGSGQIITECYTTITSPSVTAIGPQVDGTLEPGAPVYLRENATTSPWLSTTRPTNSGGVVRIVGHLMYQRSTDVNYWLMHFRPDHTWVQITSTP